MISCTEFIPSYSELFTYLEDHYGRSEVERFWTYLFKPTGKGIPLINYAREKGMLGILARHTNRRGCGLRQVYEREKRLDLP